MPGQCDLARRTLRTWSAAAKVASSRTSQASDSGQVASAAGAPLHQPPRPPGATPKSRASASTAPARVTRGAALTPSALLSQHHSCAGLANTLYLGEEYFHAYNHTHRLAETLHLCII